MIDDLLQRQVVDGTKKLMTRKVGLRLWFEKTCKKALRDEIPTTSIRYYGKRLTGYVRSDFESEFYCLLSY